MWYIPRTPLFRLFQLRHRLRKDPNHAQELVRTVTRGGQSLHQARQVHKVAR